METSRGDAAATIVRRDVAAPAGARAAEALGKLGPAAAPHVVAALAIREALYDPDESLEDAMDMVKTGLANMVKALGSAICEPLADAVADASASIARRLEAAWALSLIGVDAAPAGDALAAALRGDKFAEVRMMAAQTLGGINDAKYLCGADDLSKTGRRGAAAATDVLAQTRRGAVATWIFRGDAPGRSRYVDIPRRRAAAAPRRQRG